MRWVDALKSWNEKKGGSWTIPKKGTPEYDAVKAVMGGSPKPAEVATQKAVATGQKALEPQDNKAIQKVRDKKVKEWAEGMKTPKPTPAVSGSGFYRGIEAVIKADTFLQKCYGQGMDMDNFIETLRLVLSGDKRDLNKTWSAEYKRDVYDMGRINESAKDAKIPPKTRKMLKSIDSRFDLRMVNTSEGGVLALLA